MTTQTRMNDTAGITMLSGETEDLEKGALLSREYLEEALAAAKRHLPGWAYALIHQAALPRSGGRASATARANAAPPPEVITDPGVTVTSKGVTELPRLDHAIAWYADNMDEAYRTLHGNIAGMVLAARRGLDTSGEYTMRSGDKVATVTKHAYADLQRFVPTSGPRNPLVAFVGAAPSSLDAARGEPFAGADGVALAERYLAPLGLRKGDVMLANVVPMHGGSHADAAIFDGFLAHELDAYRPRVVIALGRVAKGALGVRADFSLPHPAALRKLGDHGEIARKVHAIRRAVFAAEKMTRDVTIAKADKAKQIVYGVVLDPYQVDTQGDWIPACEIEKTAHDYMATSRVVGLQHAKQAEAVVVESHVVQYPTPRDYEAAMNNQPHRAYRMPYGDQVVHSGAWVLGTKVMDSKVWQRVEKGDIGAYSIGGSGVRTEITHEHMPKVTFVDMRCDVLPDVP